jgi:hypothetical protein
MFPIGVPITNPFSTTFTPFSHFGDTFPSNEWVGDTRVKQHMHIKVIH